MPQLTQVWYQYEVSSTEEKKRMGSVLYGKGKTGELLTECIHSNQLPVEQV